MHVQMTDVVNMFTHDKVPSLKCYPKVIINQSCDGPDILLGAGGPESQPEPWTPPPARIAIGADVIVCDASSNSAKAWVTKTEGSVFIATLINVMGEYFQKEHFYDILVEVNDKVSRQIINAQVGNGVGEAFQMQCIHSRLTKKFYLALP